MESNSQMRGDEQVIDGVSLKELIIKVSEWLRYLLSKWWIISIVCILGAVLGLVYAASKKIVYTAACTFVLEEGGTGGGLSQYAGIASMMGVDIGGGGGIFQGDNIIELYKSRSMIQKTLLKEVVSSGKKELLIERYILINNKRESWSKEPQLLELEFKSDSRFSRIQDSVIGTIVDDIRSRYLRVSKPDKKLSIIKVEVKSEDEVFSKSFNDEIVKNVNDFYVQTKTKKSLYNVNMLQQKVDSVRSVMNGAVYRAVAATDATPNINPTRQVQRVVPMQRAQISVETNKAILSDLVKNLEMSKMALRQETPLIQVIDEPVYPLEKYKVVKIKAVLIGAIIAGFLAVLFLSGRMILKSIME